MNKQTQEELADVLIALKEWIISTEKRLAKLEQESKQPSQEVVEIMDVMQYGQSFTKIAAEPAQEPMAWMYENDVTKAYFETKEDSLVLEYGCKETPLYTHPAQPWQGLTDDERIKCYETSGHKQHIRPQDKFAVLELSIAIEQALKEKNT